MYYCNNHEDHTNCSDPEKVAIICDIKGYSSKVSKSIVCTVALSSQFMVAVRSLCDDGIDGECVSTSPFCKVHKHLLCDGKSDCKDKVSGYDVDR